jgi:hypothetical protein
MMLRKLGQPASDLCEAGAELSIAVKDDSQETLIPGDPPQGHRKVVVHLGVILIALSLNERAQLGGYRPDK